MKVLLTQPASRVGEIAADIGALIDGEAFPECDVAVLPELIGGTASTHDYENTIAELAIRWKCHVVGGSHYRPMEDGLINSGIVSDEHGRIVARYQKVRPYGSELGKGVLAGDRSGSFNLLGRKVSVLICSDIWFSDSFSELAAAPDVVLIPSFSITQKQNPDSARQLWKHMAISRAYEHTAYVGISDWAHPCKFDGLASAGVTGLVDPNPTGDVYYTSQTGKLGLYDLDFGRLDSLRKNRAARGFL